jgi:hypothetical protein
VGEWEGEEGRFLGFVALLCVWVYFCYCSGGCFCQGLQGAGIVYSWYSKLFTGGECVGSRSSVVTGWGRVGGEGKDWERVDERGQKE